MTLFINKQSVKEKYPAKRPLAYRIFSIVFLTTISASVSSVLAESNDYKNRPLDVRVERLERLMSSQKQLELLYRLKQLQEENQQLRSLIESQGNEIRLLKQQQRELFSDLNRRFGQTEDNNIENVDSSLNLSDKGSKNTVRNPGKAASSQQPGYGVTEREEIIVVRQKQKPMTDKELKAEQKAYQSAYNEIRALRYNQARTAFTNFIQQYPNGRYAHIAQYWIAEASYAQHNYEQAIIDYQRLSDVYPFSPKKAEAELKKAYSYYELGQKEKARRTLDALLRTYPETTEAGQAKRLLKKL